MQNDNVITKPFQTIDLQLLGADVYRVQLRSEEGSVPEYYAGQYLEIVLPSGESCAFSIASAPVDQQAVIELHIQRVSGKESSRKLFEVLEAGSVTVRMPKGRCHIKRLPERPLLLIAAGTGFAQMKSIVEYCLNVQHKHDIHLYWGARNPGDFYLPNLPVQWSGKGLHYHPVVSDAKSDDDWCGRFGLLYEAVLADKDKLSGSEVYISGSPKMVYATMDAITAHGFGAEAIHSDVFEYAPRD